MNERRHTSYPLLRKPVLIIRRLRALTGFKTSTQIGQTVLYSALCLLPFVNASKSGPTAWQHHVTKLSYVCTKCSKYFGRQEKIRNLIGMFPQTDLLPLSPISAGVSNRGKEGSMCHFHAPSGSSHEPLTHFEIINPKAILSKQVFI